MCCCLSGRLSCLHYRVSTPLALSLRRDPNLVLLKMLQDEDSQAILSLLQCTNSRLSFSGSMGGGGGGLGVGGDASKDATATTADGAAGKRRARDQYSGELDAREVANGFGMGMSSKVFIRMVLRLIKDGYTYSSPY